MGDEQNGLISRDITVSGDPSSKLLKSKLHNWKHEPRLGTGYEEIIANTLSGIMTLWFSFLGRLYFFKDMDGNDTTSGVCFKITGRGGWGWGQRRSKTGSCVDLWTLMVMGRGHRAFVMQSLLLVYAF